MMDVMNMEIGRGQHQIPKLCDKNKKQKGADEIENSSSQKYFGKSHRGLNEAKCDRKEIKETE